MSNNIVCVGVLSRENVVYPFPARQYHHHQQHSKRRVVGAHRCKLSPEASQRFADGIHMRRRGTSSIRFLIVLNRFLRLVVQNH